jgi:triosephosphate isomerase
MSKKFWIGANWKMNPVPQHALEKDSPFHSGKNSDVVVFPTAVDLKTCIDAGLVCGGQWGCAKSLGACTGDVCMELIQKAGATHVLCGHSERRTQHHETDEEVAAEVKCALETGLTAVLCIGETADERAAGKTDDVLKKQLSMILTSDFVLRASDFVVAYEPVWAIGTGKTPKPEEADLAHAFIRSLLPDPKIRIVYGGSVTAANAAGFFAQQNIDGALVGAASLKPEEFKKIVEADIKAGM